MTRSEPARRWRRTSSRMRRGGPGSRCRRARRSLPTRCAPGGGPTGQPMRRSPRRGGGPRSISALAAPFRSSPPTPGSFRTRRSSSPVLKTPTPGPTAPTRACTWASSSGPAWPRRCCCATSRRPAGSADRPAVPAGGPGPLAAALAPGRHTCRMSDAHAVPEADRYQWLEDVTGAAALDWVRERNAEALATLSDSARFEELRTEIREVLDADDRIPYPRRRGAYLYNFWQDEAHPRGLWRRTTLEEYRRAQPDWDVLLDVDALAQKEDENWVWQGATALRAGGYRLALVQLSRGGADASVVREFDVAERCFVSGGFEVPEAKTDVDWIDADQIYVGTDFGPGSLTSSGYPRLVRQWLRGTPLAEAAVVYEGQPEDVSVHAFHDPTEGFERDFVVRSIDFYRSEWYLRRGDGDLVRLAVPEDADVDVHREWLVIRTRSAWTVDGAAYPAGALLAARFDRFLDGDRQLAVLFEPD